MMEQIKQHIISAVCGFVFPFAVACTTSQNGQQEVNNTDEATVEVEKENLTGGLNHPWGMAFLPDGRLLVTERSGDLRILDKDNKLSDPVPGVPEVFNKGQGGLLDVVLDPDFSSNQFVYLTFSEPGANNTASTALGRGRLEDNQIKDFQVLFSQEPKIEGDKHFGSRVLFSPDGKIYLVLGERFQFDPAQDLSNHMGAVIRINRDGTVPQDNPFVNENNAQPEIWSYGHRNIEAAAFEPGSGRLWIAEMGPQGGDELNLVESGKNYGWPIVSWGEHYDGEDIPDPTTRPEFEDAVVHWTPVISPSGMIFYNGEMFPALQGEMLIGGLSSKGLVRVIVNGDQAEETGRIDLGARIRDVEQAPDGSLYVLTDQNNGNVWRLIPKQ